MIQTDSASGNTQIRLQGIGVQLQIGEDGADGQSVSEFRMDQQRVFAEGAETALHRRMTHGNHPFGRHVFRVPVFVGRIAGNRHRKTVVRVSNSLASPSDTRSTTEQISVLK